MPETRFQPEHDTLSIAAQETLITPLQFGRQVLVNGEPHARKLYPQLRGLTRARTLVNATISSLQLRTGRCSLCSHRLTSEPRVIDEDGDDLPAYRSAMSLEYCSNCRHWEFLELRSETYDVRADLADLHTITLTSSKIRSFDEVTPEGTLNEIAQFIRRNP